MLKILPQVLGVVSIAIFSGCTRETNESQVSSYSYEQNSYDQRDESASYQSLDKLAYGFYESLDEREKPLYADRYGNCGDVSIIWPEALKAKGVKFWLEQTEVAGQLETEGLFEDLTRSEQYLSKTHFFLSAEYKGQKYIFDPTYLQFFEKVPTELVNRLIFVGTEDELRSLYKKYEPYLRLDVEGDSNWGYYKADQLFEFIYSTGEYSSSRMTIPLN